VTNYNITDETDLKNAIALVAAGTGSYSFTFENSLTLSSGLAPIQLGNGASLLITSTAGNTFALDGASTYGGFVFIPIVAGDTSTVAITNLDINNTKETGGAGATTSHLAGGGGAGLGGGVFLGAGTSATLTNVSFNGDDAVGGAGGLGGPSYPAVSGTGGSLNTSEGVAGYQGGAPDMAGGFGGGGAYVVNGGAGGSSTRPAWRGMAKPRRRMAGGSKAGRSWRRFATGSTRVCESKRAKTTHRTPIS